MSGFGVEVAVPGTQEAWSLGGSYEAYAVWLPHSCDEWVIGSGTREQVLEAIATMQAELEAAKAAIEAHQP